MRRLLARAAGRFPRGTLARMWRELFGAMTRVQSSLAVSVVVPEDQPELWDVVRDHFGSLTPIRRAESAEEALGRIAAGQAQVAVLPLPGEADRWWLGLADGPLRVQARLPFATLPSYPDQVQAFVVARLPPESTGDDLTLLLLETDEVQSGSDPRLSRHLLRSEPEAGTVRHLVEIGGFFTEDGPPLRGSAGAGRRRALARAGARLLRASAPGRRARLSPAPSARYLACLFRGRAPASSRSHPMSAASPRSRATGRSPSSPATRARWDRARGPLPPIVSLPASCTATPMAGRRRCGRRSAGGTISTPS